MKPIIKVCHGKSCTERFSPYIIHRLQADQEFFSYPAGVEIETCLCQGRCAEGPTVVFAGETHTRMNPITASQILSRKIQEWKRQKSL